MKDRYNILLAGIGGQGIITSSMILGQASLNADINVLGAETHGMAQRGGSVEVHVRLGDVYSPLIPTGSADVMVSMEPVEAVRYSHYLSSETVVVLNTRKVVPLSASLQGLEYPSIEEIQEKLREIGCEVYTLDATGIAERVAKAQATNVVLLGSLCKAVELPLKYQHLEEGLKQILPPKLQNMNVKALRSGYDAL